MATKPLIREALLMLDICGVNPVHNSTGSKCRMIISEILLFLLWTEVLSECIYKWNGLDSMEDIVTVIGLSQVALKLSVLVLNRRKLIKVLDGMSDFWPSNVYSSKLQNETSTIYNLIKKALLCLTFFITAALLAYFLQPLFSVTKRLPFRTYHPTNLTKFPDYELAYILQLFSILSIFPLQIGFDSLFVSLTVTIIFEIKLLKEKLAKLPIKPKAIKDGNTLQELIKIINHHNLILKCARGINRVYYVLFLNTFFLDMLCICTCLICITASGTPPTLESLTKYGPDIMFLLVQLFMYCAAGSYIKVETESVSFATYETDWWIRTQPELRRWYVLVIQRGNKAEQLTAGKMFDVNLECFTQIIRNILSFFTLIQAVCRK